jgi:ABC-type branched-subunit amino acid transport system ATPase component
MHDIHAVPLLCATALTRRFGGLTAVAQVSLDLHVGQLHAVIGTNGAGKSTLINMLSGEIAPTSGSIALGGVDVTGWTQPAHDDFSPIFRAGKLPPRGAGRASAPVDAVAIGARLRPFHAGRS